MKLVKFILVILLSVLFFPVWLMLFVIITVILSPVSVFEYVFTGDSKIVKKTDEFLFDKCGKSFFSIIDKLE